MKTEEELIRSGDRNYYKSLYCKMFEGTIGWILAKFPSLERTDAEDLFQNAIVSATIYFRNNDVKKETGGIEGFIIRNVKMKAINLIKKKAVRQQYIKLNKEECYEVNDCGLPITDKKELFEKLKLLMSVLKDDAIKCQKLLAVLCLHFDYDFVCNNLGLYSNTDSAKSAKYECVKKAKSLLEKLK